MGWRRAGKKRFANRTSQGRDGRREGKALAVNVSDLEKKFEAGAEITVESLAKAGFSDNPKIKILGTGEGPHQEVHGEGSLLGLREGEDREGRRLRRLTLWLSSLKRERGSDCCALLLQLPQKKIMFGIDA